MKRILMLAVLLLLSACVTTGVPRAVPIGNTVPVHIQTEVKPLFAGSAAVLTVSRDCEVVALTAKHVVEGEGPFLVRDIEVAVRLHETADLARIEFKLPACDGLRGAQIGTAREGDTIYATGFVTSNVMTSVHRGVFYPSPVPGRPTEVGLPVAAYFGMSGGGVYLDSGELIGLVVGGWPEFTSMSRVVLLTPETLAGVGV
jgi:hypothetical protein